MGHRRPGHRDGQQEQRHGEAGRRMGSEPLGATAEADQPGPAAGETGQGEDRGGEQRHGRQSNPSTRALIRTVHSSPLAAACPRAMARPKPQ